MNKRGLLLAEETLKLIISVIAIGFLAYLLFSLYFNFKDSQKLEQAEASLDFLISEMGKGEEQVTFFNPENWVLLSWPYQNEAQIPKSCSNQEWESCFCIVEDLKLGDSLISILPFTKDIQEKFIEQSDSNGKCVENSGGFIVKENDVQKQILIRAPLNLNINYETKVISN